MGRRVCRRVPHPCVLTMPSLLAHTIKFCIITHWVPAQGDKQIKFEDRKIEVLILCPVGLVWGPDHI